MVSFYGIGIGPGDPELITIKALKVLRAVDLIFVPRARSGEGSLARAIVEKAVDGAKEFVEIEFPMTKDTEELNRRYIESAGLILEKIRGGRRVAYLTIGDPLLYSTYVYLLEALFSLAPDLEVETIPGISAYSAVAARFGYSLAEKDERVCICPAPEDMETLREVLESNDTVVIMKASRRLPEIITLLGRMNLLRNAVFGSRVGLEGERLIDARKEHTVSMGRGYLSTVIVRKR